MCSCWRLLKRQSLSYVCCFIGFIFTFKIDHIQQGGERMESGGHSNSFGGGAWPANAPPPPWCRPWLSSTLTATTEALNPQLLPGRRSNMVAHCSGCVFTVCVCVCALGWVKCRAQIQSMCHHTWPHVTSIHFH